MAKLGGVAGSAAGVAGAVVGVVVGVGVGICLFWLKDDSPTITIAGHTGCLNPPDRIGDPPRRLDWEADRWAAVVISFTETRQAHGYETVYEHIIYSCGKLEST